jgi:uncharacterized membrane protein
MAKPFKTSCYRLHRSKKAKIKIKVIVANNEAYNTIIGKYLDYSKFYRPLCYMLHHATITFILIFAFLER